jgi:ATP-dependent Clp protease ATP-binding subunit ClpB
MCPKRSRKEISLDLDRFWRIKISREFEERFKAVMNEVENRPENILFIDGFALVRAGAGGFDGCVNMLKPALSRGKLRLSDDDAEEYQRLLAGRGPERRFQPIYVSEPSVEDTVAILHGLRKYEIHHGCGSLTELSSRPPSCRTSVTDGNLPDKRWISSTRRLFSANEIDSMPAEIDDLDRKENLKLRRRA